MSRLTIFGADGRQEVELLPHNTLGRHPNNTVQVLDRVVSKEHCHVDLVDGRFILRDLGSLNGTYVNGERVVEKFLAPGDEITLGSTRIIFDESRREGHETIPFRKSREELPTKPNPLAVQALIEESKAAASGGSAIKPPTLKAGDNPVPPRPPLSKVTIAPGMVESHIRSKLAPAMTQNFVAEQLIEDTGALRRDYEKLRVSYELARAIGVELDINKLLVSILDAAFQLLAADRGVILLYGNEAELTPRCVRQRQKGRSDEVVISSTIVEQVLREKSAVLSSDATVDARFSGAHSIIMQGIRSSMAVPLLHSDEVFGIMLLDSQIATNAFTEKDLQLFQTIANQAAVAIQNSLYAEKLEKEAVTRERFQRLLSPAIAQQVIAGEVEVKKGGEVRNTTVLFSDIRGFTAMSESRAAQDIVEMLNEYFERMVEVIFKYEGTLDKFVGDEIMALYGAPVGHPDDPVRAVRTAIEMKDVLQQFNLERRTAGQQEINVGIGINTGECVAGYLGSSRALEYTVIGDTVNTAARLCSTAKAGEIIISEQVYAEVEHLVEVNEFPPTHVKGKALPLRIFNVMGLKK